MSTTTQRSRSDEHGDERAARPIAPRPPRIDASWSVHDASELYEVARWGKGYFSVNDAGHVRSTRPRTRRRAIDLKELVDRLQLRGISLPLLLRFTDILKHRLGEIHDAFQNAIAQHQYQGGYSCVYPIKVNQQRQVVEEVLNFGKPYNFGLEAGSKPELLAVLALADNDDADHLQRLQGRRVHRDGDAGPQDRPQHHPGRREIHRAGADPRSRREARRPAADRHARQAGRARQRPLAVVGRLPLEVRPDASPKSCAASRS